MNDTASTAANAATNTESGASFTTASDEKQFTITRVFDAPRSVIWDAWTNPDTAAAWWHPPGVSTPRESVSIDARAGGQYSYTMVNDANGEQYPTAGHYLEVVPEERLVFTWASPGDTEELPLITVTLREVGETTEMTFHLQGWAGAPGDGDVYDGWQGAFGILTDSLS